MLPRREQISGQSAKRFQLGEAVSRVSFFYTALPVIFFLFIYYATLISTFSSTTFLPGNYQ